MPLHIAGKTPSDFIHSLFAKPTQRGSVQLFRYGLVAIVAFGIDFGLLFVFSSLLRWHYLVATTLAFALSVIMNYYLSTLWVFSQRTKREAAAEITLFVAICFVALLLNDLFMWIFTSGFHIYYLISKLATVMIVFIWSFGARRILFHGDITRNKFVRALIGYYQMIQRKGA